MTNGFAGLPYQHTVLGVCRRSHRPTHYFAPDPVQVHGQRRSYVRQRVSRIDHHLRSLAWQSVCPAVGRGLSCRQHDRPCFVSGLVVEMTKRKRKERNNSVPKLSTILVRHERGAQFRSPPHLKPSYTPQQHSYQLRLTHRQFRTDRGIVNIWDLFVKKIVNGWANKLKSRRTIKRSTSAAHRKESATL